MDTVQSSPAIEAFWSYTKAFQSLDAVAVAAHYHEPAMMISPDGVHAFSNAAAVSQGYARVMADLSSKRYSRTAFSPIEERRLSEDVSLLTGSGSWIDSDGRPLMAFGMTFTLRRVENIWKIVVAIVHSADAT
jgi:ketosteroid isomerase-like protein